MPTAGPHRQVRICGLLGLFRRLPAWQHPENPEKLAMFLGCHRESPIGAGRSTRSIVRLRSAAASRPAISRTFPRRRNDPGTRTGSRGSRQGPPETPSLSVHPCGDSFTLASQLAQDLGYVVRDNASRSCFLRAARRVAWSIWGREPADRRRRQSPLKHRRLRATRAPIGGKQVGLAVLEPAK